MDVPSLKCFRSDDLGACNASNRNDGALLAGGKERLERSGQAVYFARVVSNSAQACATPWLGSPFPGSVAQPPLLT